MPKAELLSEDVKPEGTIYEIDVKRLVQAYGGVPKFCEAVHAEDHQVGHWAGYSWVRRRSVPGWVIAELLLRDKSFRVQEYILKRVSKRVQEILDADKDPLHEMNIKYTPEQAITLLNEVDPQNVSARSASYSCRIFAQAHYPSPMAALTKLLGDFGAATVREVPQDQYGALYAKIREYFRAAIAAAAN